MCDFAVIFDFNGTMLFDTQIQFRAWNDLAEETLGHGLSEEEFLRCTNGRPSRETVEYFWGDVEEEQMEELVARKRRKYKELCLAHPEMFHLADGMTEVLDLLKEHEIPFTIATSSNPRSMDFYFEHLGLAAWFDRDAVICSDRRFPGKPAPDIYRIAAQELGFPPEQCIVVEDALAGAYAARSAGIGYIVIIDPESSGSIWVGDQVDYVINEYHELYEQLCNIMHAFHIEAQENRKKEQG